MARDTQSFWSTPLADLLDTLQATAAGLTTDDALKRLDTYGANQLNPPKRSDAFTHFIAQFKSPIILILLFATGLSLFLRNMVDASIIFIIVIISGLLGFWQEHSASNAVQKLLAIVKIKATVVRDGKQQEIAIEEIVPGDVVALNAGDIVPGDCLLLESKSFRG